MTEQEYINAANITRLRVVKRELRECVIDPSDQNSTRWIRDAMANVNMLAMNVEQSVENDMSNAKE